VLYCRPPHPTRPRCRREEDDPGTMYPTTCSTSPAHRWRPARLSVTARDVGQGTACRGLARSSVRRLGRVRPCCAPTAALEKAAAFSPRGPGGYDPCVRGRRIGVTLTATREKRRRRKRNDMATGISIGRTRRHSGRRHGAPLHEGPTVADEDGTIAAVAKVVARPRGNRAKGPFGHNAGFRRHPLPTWGRPGDLGFASAASRLARRHQGVRAIAAWALRRQDLGTRPALTS